MTPYYSDALLDFYHGDVLDTLRQLPDESVQCVVTSPPYWGLRSYLPNEHPDKQHELGLEPTPAEYVAKLVAVFDEVRRVLRSDGVCWLNLGSSYASKPFPELGIEHKDDCMIPARVAIALQEAGWYIRSEIVWAKKSPMPESVTDRPTSATEKIFLLTKSARYFYDADAVKVPSTSESPSGNGYRRDERLSLKGRGSDKPWQMSPTRNLWNYWLLSPEPFPDAHFAVFPTAIPRTAILAGTSERGACPDCGVPWRRVVEREGKTKRQVMYERGESAYFRANGNALNYAGGHSVPERTGKTTGWAPTCDCDAGPPRPCVVLDPFLGSGTTALVAQQLGRKCIGIDLNADYLDMAVQRCAQKTIWGMTL